MIVFFYLKVLYVKFIYSYFLFLPELWNQDSSQRNANSDKTNKKKNIRLTDCSDAKIKRP